MRTKKSSSIVPNDTTLKYYFYFIQERMNIFWRSCEDCTCLTDDPILREYKFTNVYRACDRVSQYLIRNVIYKDLDKYSPEDVLLRILVFKVFNRIETWEYLSHILDIRLDTFDVEKLSKYLSGRQRNYPIFSNAYMMTGGFDCDMVEPGESHKLLFSNLFFGFEGMVSNPFADSVLAVRAAKQCRIYQKRMRVDEKLLIQKDYEHLFGNDIQMIISETDEESKLLKAWDDELRRIYIFMNIESDEQHRLDTEDLFSKQFIPYYRVRNNGEKPVRAMKDLVVDALRMMYLGTVVNNSGVVQITMSAESGVMQSVQLVAGEIYTSKITLEKEKDNVFNSGKYNLMLQINKKNVIKLTLPMLDYFEDLRNGVIETNMDPQLTHGIEKLKAMLLSKANIDDYGIQICMMTNTGEPELMSIDIEDGMLMVR